MDTMRSEKCREELDVKIKWNKALPSYIVMLNLHVITWNRRNQALSSFCQK